MSKTLAGEVTNWNQGAERLYGYREEEMIGQSVRFLIPPERQDEEDAILARIAADQRVPEYETVRFHKQGHPIAVSVSVSPIRDGSGAIIGALTIARDLTRYKEAEARIKEGKDQLRLALQAAKLGVWRWDVGTGEDRAHWDEACKALFGLPSDAAVSYETWAAAIHPDDRTQAEAGVARAIDPSDPFDDYVCEYRVQHPDGTIHWIAANGRAFFESDRLCPAERRAKFFSGTVRDVTAAKEGDDIRRNQEKRDRFFLDLERQLQAAKSAREAVGMACESLARELRAPYSSVAEAGADSEEYVIVNAWSTRPVLESLPTPPRFASRSVSWVAPLHRGETTKVRDILQEPPTPAGEELVKRFAQRGLRSVLLVPAMRLGKPRACLVIGDTSPRDWTEFESALARETLDRCWHAVERARAEESLRESEERFRGVYENAGTGIAIADLNGKFQSCNPAYSQMLGYTEAELRNLICASLLHPEDGGVNLTQQRRLVAGEIPLFELLSRYITKRGELIWGYRHVTLLRDASGNPRNVIALVTDMTDRKRQEEQIELLMREVNHRSKNMLTVVHAIARQTAATRPEDFIGRFGERIIALAASQDLLIKNDWKGVDFHDLVQSQLAHFKDLICTRIRVRGPRLTIATAAAQNIGMALHELATNAGKYGALSGSEGQVAIDWKLDGVEDGTRTFFMTWKEMGGPPVEPPSRTGFGSTVISSVIKDSLEADVELDYAAAGLTWRMSCPAHEVIQADRCLSPDLHSE